MQLLPSYSFVGTNEARRVRLRRSARAMLSEGELAMSANATLHRETGIAQYEDEYVETYVSSYKCEECGKIIAAAGDRPAPICCGDPMHKIR